jgi:hypothetical protein
MNFGRSIPLNQMGTTEKNPMVRKLQVSFGILMNQTCPKLVFFVLDAMMEWRYMACYLQCG